MATQNALTTYMIGFAIVLFVAVASLGIYLAYRDRKRRNTRRKQRRVTRHK